MATNKSKAAQSRSAVAGLMIFCAVGISVSVYAYYVETAFEADDSYKAMCDISDSVSCTKVFASRYGKGFGLVDRIFSSDSILNQPNSLYGVLFYIIEFVFCLLHSPEAVKLQVLISAVACCSCVYLALILYLVLYNFCIICITTYVLNAGILICSILRMKNLNNRILKKRS